MRNPPATIAGAAVMYRSQTPPLVTKQSDSRRLSKTHCEPTPTAATLRVQDDGGEHLPPLASAARRLMATSSSAPAGPSPTSAPAPPGRCSLRSAVRAVDEPRGRPTPRRSRRCLVSRCRSAVLGPGVGSARLPAQVPAPPGHYPSTSPLCCGLYEDLGPFQPPLLTVMLGDRPPSQSPNYSALPTRLPRARPSQATRGSGREDARPTHEVPWPRVARWRNPTSTRGGCRRQ
jgi:hypothetical protein